MSRHEYYADALAYADANGYTPVQVADASFVQMCGVLGFDPDDSPADFFYRNIRRLVAKELKRQEDDAADAARLAKIKAKILELVEMAGAEVQKLNAGESSDKTGWLITKE